MFVVMKKVWAPEKPGEQIGLSCAVGEARYRWNPGQPGCLWGRGAGSPGEGALTYSFHLRGTTVSLIIPSCLSATHQTPAGQPAVRKHCLLASWMGGQCVDRTILESCTFKWEVLVRRQELRAGVAYSENVKQHQTLGLLQKGRLWFSTDSLGSS